MYALKASRFPAAFLIWSLLTSPSVLAGGGHDEKKVTYPTYMPMNPAIVVNLAGTTRTRFLRVEIQLYVQTAEDAQAIDRNMPVLRDKLVTMLGGRDPDSLQQPGAREALRNELREALRDTLMLNAGREAIDDLFFTGFIMQ